MFPNGEVPPLDSMCALLQMLLLLLNRLGCLHGEIQDIWRVAAKNRKDLSRRALTAGTAGTTDSSVVNSVLANAPRKVKAEWEECQGRIQQLKTDIGRRHS